MIRLPRSLDEVGQLAGPEPKIFEIKDAYSQSAEESRHPVLGDLATRTQQRRTGSKRGAEGQKVVLVSARAMKEKKGRYGRAGAGSELVDESETAGCSHVAPSDLTQREP